MGAPRITCDCGQTKTQRNDYMVCDHCDGGCEIKGCNSCIRYSGAVSRRLTA